MAAATAFILFVDLFQHLVLEVGVLVGAKYNGLAHCDVVVAFGGCSLDFVLNETLTDSLGETAFFLNGEEIFPSVLGYGIGKVFDIIGAGGGVGNLVEIRFLFEQYLLVAGNAVREIVGLLVGDVERSHGDRVGAGNGHAHGLGGGAQHVHMGIVKRFVPNRRCSMDEHLVSAVAGRMVLLHNLRPQQTCSTYFGHLHKIVGADGEAEHHILGHFFGSHAHVGKFCHKLVGGGKGEAEFLNYAGTAVLEQVAVHRKHAETGQVAVGKFDESFCQSILPFFATAEIAVVEGMFEHIEIDTSLHCLGVDALGAEILYKEFQQSHKILGAVEVYLNLGGVDVL